MQTLRCFLCGLLLLTAGTVLPAAAQFQGTIVLDSYEIENGERSSSDTFTLYVTPERILLQGENSYRASMPFETDGVLIRMDFEDFVFLTGDDKALTISKADITAFMNMFSDEPGSGTQNDDAPQVNYERTGETRQIRGYTCEKFVVRDRDGQHRTEIWMTDGLEINWGMLAEPWLDETSMMAEEDDFPLSAVFKDGYFPLRIENYRGDRQTAVTEVSRIQSSPVARAMVEIPSGVTVLTLQDYLFQRMNGN